MFAFLPAFLLKFLGSGVIESVLAHKRQMAETKTASEKIRADVEIKGLENELDRRRLIAELQGREYQHWALWWPKMIIMMSVAQYVAISFVVRSLNLSADYNIIVPELTVWQAGIASGVTAYLFIAK